MADVTKNGVADVRLASVPTPIRLTKSLLTSAEKRMYAVISFLRSNFFFPGVSVLFTDPMLGILKFYNDFVFCSVAVTLLSVVS